jgi:hypothetical protein
MDKTFLTDESIRSAFDSGEITWADVIEVTGMTHEQAFNLLHDLINKPTNKTEWELS